MVKVKAQSRGYVGGILREHGEVFEWPDGHKLGSWVEPIGSASEQPSESGKQDDGGKGKAKAEGKGKAKAVASANAAPFADAPEPEVIKGNGVKEVLGVAPDWMPPGADDGKPVQADD